MYPTTDFVSLIARYENSFQHSFLFELSEMNIWTNKFHIHFFRINLNKHIWYENTKFAMAPNINTRESSWGRYNIGVSIIQLYLLNVVHSKFFINEQSCKTENWQGFSSYYIFLYWLRVLEFHILLNGMKN